MYSGGRERAVGQCHTHNLAKAGPAGERYRPRVNKERRRAAMRGPVPSGPIGRAGSPSLRGGATDGVRFQAPIFLATAVTASTLDRRASGRSRKSLTSDSSTPVVAGETPRASANSPIFVRSAAETWPSDQASR